MVKGVKGPESWPLPAKKKKNTVLLFNLKRGLYEDMRFWEPSYSISEDKMQVLGIQINVQMSNK